MAIPKTPSNETQRLAALHRYKLLDTEAETLYDDITKLSALICRTPMSMISLVDTSRQWFKSKIGMEASETSRDISICAHAIHETKIMIVNDATQDERTRDNPVVTGEAHIRFYAGAPLMTPEGYSLGTLCVADHEARELSKIQIDALESLARQVSANFELRLLNDKLLAENETKNRLFSILAHDLKAPFTPILGFAKMLHDEIQHLEKDEIAEYAEIIHRNSEHVFLLVQDLLTWSRHELGAIKFHPTRLELDVVMEELMDLFNGVAKQKSIDLSFTPNKAAVFQGDKEMINTVLRNLISNALKFTPVGGRVTVTSEKKLSTLEIRVSDSGVGIPKERQEQLFNVDSHFSTEGTAKEKGTGLGLPLCKDFVERHKGKIRVESTEGKGTTIVVTLPLAG